MKKPYQIPENQSEHMCLECNRNTAGCDRVRLRVKGKFVASIHAECAFGLPWDADVIAESPTQKEVWEPKTTDPLEQIIEIALHEAGIPYYTENAPENEHNLDFFLPEQDLYVEVKGGATPRIADQMTRHQNIMVIQGKAAALTFAKMLTKQQL